MFCRRHGHVDVSANGRCDVCVDEAQLAGDAAVGVRGKGCSACEFSGREIEYVDDVARAVACRWCPPDEPEPAARKRRAFTPAN